MVTQIVCLVAELCVCPFSLYAIFSHWRHLNELGTANNSSSQNQRSLRLRPVPSQEPVPPYDSDKLPAYDESGEVRGDTTGGPVRSPRGEGDNSFADGGTEAETNEHSHGNARNGCYA